MDTSEEYIKMCDCEEMQNNHIFSTGDYFILIEGYYGCFDFGLEYQKGEIIIVDEFSEFSSDAKAIWLPRQDQLQDILYEPIYKNFVYWESKFHEWCDNQERHEFIIGGCYSMEQLWLAFVMYRKFNKKWTGEAWE